VSPRATAARSREPRSTRDLILDAAEHRFAERGFAGVSMRELAAEAGLKNQASLYHHFRHKRALYEAVLARGVETILALIEESARPANGRNALDPAVVGAYLDRMLDYLAEHPHLPRLIQRAALEGNRQIRNTATRLLRPVYERGVGVLAGGRAPWPAADLPHVAAGIYHMIFGYFANGPLLEGVIQENLRSPAAVERQRRFLKTAVAALLGTGRARLVPSVRRMHT
jgi:AcrR family transcriptional regulator